MCSSNLTNHHSLYLDVLLLSSLFLEDYRNVHREEVRIITIKIYNIVACQAHPALVKQVQCVPYF